jgi:hypothetical protein
MNGIPKLAQIILMIPNIEVLLYCYMQTVHEYITTHYRLSSSDIIYIDSCVY